MTKPVREQLLKYFSLPPPGYVPSFLLHVAFVMEDSVRGWLLLGEEDMYGRILVRVACAVAAEAYLSMSTHTCVC
jgi:hypothetical protein